MNSLTDKLQGFWKPVTPYKVSDGFRFYGKGLIMTEQAAEQSQQAAEQPQQAQQEPQQAAAEQPQQANPYESIIEQQQAQINALLEQTANLNQQIVNMVNSGAQFTSAQPAQPEEPKPMQQFNPQPLSEGDNWSLESLAKDIGKRD